MKHNFAHFPLHPLNKAEKKTWKGLTRILRPDQVSTRWPDRLSYGRDCNSKGILWVRQGKVKYPPQFIVWPEKTQEVSQVLQFAKEKDLPVIPFGGGSGVCGGTWALKGGIALDLKRMDQILDWNRKRMTITAQTGINGEILERELNSRGYTLGHFPSSIYAATLGGYLACRSAGQLSSYYGKIEDMVEGLEVVLPSGEVVKIASVTHRPQTLDLKEIFLGSEGTLGAITQATLSIYPKPERQRFLGFQFRNLQRGLAAARELMQAGVRPAVLRLYDPLDSLLAGSYNGKKESEGVLEDLGEVLRSSLNVAGNLSLKMALKKPGWINNILDFLPSHCLMIVGFEGPKALVPAQVASAEAICQRNHGKALGEEVGNYWYQHRYSVSYKLSPYFDNGFFADTLETATTWKNLLPLYRSVRESLSQRALVFAHFSHAYPMGCSIYFTFLGYAPEEKASEQSYDEIWRSGLKACHLAGGTLSHHHGVGVLKSGQIRKEWGDAFEWLCKLKRKLDPENRMNPGKLGFPLEWE